MGTVSLQLKPGGDQTEHENFKKTWDAEKTRIEQALKDPKSNETSWFRNSQEYTAKTNLIKMMVDFKSKDPKKNAMVLKEVQPTLDEKNSWANTKSAATAVGGASILTTLFSFCSG